MAKRKKRVSRRAWFKPFSRRNQSQPDPYRMGVLYGKKHIPLDEQVREQWMADKDYLQEMTYYTHEELRALWRMSIRKRHDVMKNYTTLVDTDVDKIKLFSNGSQWCFFRYTFYDDGKPKTLIRSIPYFSREKAMDAFWARLQPISWHKVLYPKPKEKEPAEKRTVSISSGFYVAAGPPEYEYKQIPGTNRWTREKVKTSKAEEFEFSKITIERLK